MKPTKILLILCNFYLGCFMIYGGINKFLKPTPKPTAQIERIEKKGFEAAKEDSHLQIRNYIFGMKQTGYFWLLLGICEIGLGLLVVSQFFSFLGAIALVPITLNIFLFHIFLEPDDVQELLTTGFIFLTNIYIIGYYQPKWKHLVFDRKFFSAT